MLLLSPLLFYEFSISRSTVVLLLLRSVCSTHWNFIKRLTILWFSICTWFFLAVLLWLLLFKLAKSSICSFFLCVAGLNTYTQKGTGQATVDLQLFSILELKYFSFQNVPAWLFRHSLFLCNLLSFKIHARECESRNSVHAPHLTSSWRCLRLCPFKWDQLVFCVAECFWLCFPMI